MIKKIKVYPHPKGCFKDTCSYQDKPNYAEEARQSAIDASNASVLAMEYAEQAAASAQKAYTKSETDALLADKKDLQTAKASPSASGTSSSFIDSISQNEQGVITATKKTVQNATASQSGLMSAADKSKLNALPTDSELDALLADKKNVQTAKASPSASGTSSSFIDSISQNEQGVITATKKTVQNATASQSGLMSAADKSKLNALPTDSELDALLADKKNVQTAKASPSASGNTAAFIDTITQNEQGIITATKKTVQAATDSQSGLMSAADKSKLNALPTDAELDALLANKVDSSDLDDYYDKSETDALLADKKDLQTAKASPSASGNTAAFIDTITQNEQGIITATKKTVQAATDSQSGLMSAADKSKLNALHYTFYGNAYMTNVEAGATAYQDITFLPPFSAQPKVVVAPYTMRPDLVLASVYDVTASGCRIYCVNNSTSATDVTVELIAIGTR